MGFYCYSCGKEVNRNTKSCPSCGVIFKAVKCPSCGYTDDADFFKGGCPRCGYMGEREPYPEERMKKKSSFGFLSARAFWAMSTVLFIVLILFLYLLLHQG